MGYDLLVHAVQPISNGEFKRVGYGPAYCSRIRSLRDIFTALEPYGIKAEAEPFKWFQHHQERVNLLNVYWDTQPIDEYGEHLPRHVLFEPRKVRQSLDLLFETAQSNGLTETQLLYFFEVLLPDGRVFTSHHLSVVADKQVWYLEGKISACTGRTPLNRAASNKQNKYHHENFLLKHVPGEQLLEGFLFDKSGPAPQRTRVEAQELAKSSAPTEQIFLRVETLRNEITFHIALLREVCDFAIENGFLLDVIHSY